MTALGAARPIPLREIYADYGWNSRSILTSKTGDGRIAFEDVEREDSESAGIEGLAEDIAIAGQLTPVDLRLVPKTGFYAPTTAPYALVCGYRRFAAITLLNESPERRARCDAEGKPIVPGLPNGHILAVNHGEMSERDASILNAEENFNRENLGPVDRCMVVRRLMSFKLSSAEIATRLGKRRAAIDDYKRVLEMDPDIFAHWSGKTDSYHGIETAKRIGIMDLFDIAKKPKDEQAEYYEKVLRERAAVEATSAWEVRARARAVATGALLAKLERQNFLVVTGREWATDSAVIMALAGLRDGHGKATGTRMTEFGMAAKAAYDREKAKLVAVPQS